MPAESSLGQSWEADASRSRGLCEEDATLQCVSALRQRALDLLRGYHQGQKEVSDEALDEALQLPVQSWARSAADHPRLQANHPGESVVNVATPYDTCRRLFHALSLDGSDRVYDLGCGSGRVILYGGLLTPARFVGVELIEARAAEARAAAEALQLGHIQVEVGHVLDQAFDDGTVFYAFRPFSIETEADVLRRIHRIARQRPITLATYRMQPSLFDPHIFEREDHGALLIHRSGGTEGD